MNNDLISREALKKAIDDYAEKRQDTLLWQSDIEEIIDNAPTVELDENVIQEVLNKRCMTAVANEYLIALHGKRPQGEFSRKDLESWLYQIAMNNIGTDFEKSVVEIIHRLDGFERFVSEQKGGAE